MAYEKVKLIYAMMSGDIYMARLNKDGFTMSDSRRKVTDEVIGAAAEWFIGNKKKMVRFAEQNNGKRPTLFFTEDEDKARRILAILEEGEKDAD